MDRANQNFFALIHMLDSSRGGKRARSPEHAAALAITRHELLPILNAAFENHPQLDTPEVLELCVPALAEALQHHLKR
jgi:hypothetical protein